MKDETNKVTVPITALEEIKQNLRIGNFCYL
jgi:hypothetical protein